MRHAASTLVARRGRVMNRAARVMDKASSGQVWASEAAWLRASKILADVGLGDRAEAHDLGSFELKGVAEPLPLVQCVLQA